MMEKPITAFGALFNDLLPVDWPEDTAIRHRHTGAFVSLNSHLLGVALPAS